MESQLRPNNGTYIDFSKDIITIDLTCHDFFRKLVSNDYHISPPQIAGALAEYIKTYGHTKFEEVAQKIALPCRLTKILSSTEPTFTN
jgi:hypothetical protein